MTWAVRENATVILDEDDPQRALMQLHHLLSLIGERKTFLILFEWPDGLSTSDFAEPEGDFSQTKGTQGGLAVELMMAGTPSPSATAAATRPRSHCHVETARPSACSRTKS